MEGKAIIVTGGASGIGCAVGRIVPGSTLPNSIDVAVERYFEWDIEAPGWKGGRPEIKGASFVENLDAYNQRKLSPSDRLVKPLLAAYEDGLAVDFLAFGPAAALRYDHPADSQSAELMRCIAAQGVEKTLEKYTGLAPDLDPAGRILSVYRALGI